MAAELPADKCREVVHAVGRSSADPVSLLLSSMLLSPAERKRLERVDTRSLEKALAQGIVAVEQAGFNESLLASGSPPPAMFAWGDTSCLARPMVAIVGTRGASAYGKACSQKFAEAFVRAGLVVVSGGAMGIDEHAHTGAMEAGGSTVAVFANGVDLAQPPKNAPLFKRIRDRGCLVSAFAVGTPAMEHRFRPRNELIAAMSLGVVVIEAPAGSGSLMTCTAAADLGREVFVVPGTIDRPGFRGSHNLIRDGATLVDSPAQVLESLGIEQGVSEEREASLSDIQKSILDSLTADPQAAEAITSQLGIESSRVMSELTLMEIEGLVVKTGTGYAVRP